MTASSTERRRRSRDLPPGPAAVPEELGDVGEEALEGILAALEDHPAHMHHRIARLDADLTPEGHGAELLASLLPVLRVDAGLSDPPRPTGEEGAPVPEGLTGALEGSDVSGLEEALRDLCLKLERTAEPKRACQSLEILARVRRELASCGHFWVSAGALSLGLPMLFASLLEGIEMAADEAPVEFAPRDLTAIAAFAAQERVRVEENLAKLGPYLHEPYVEGPLRLGAERMMDAWRIMLNGLDSHVFGGVREL